MSGGSGTKSFSLSGSLPSGLSFSSTTGAINDPDAGSFTLTQAWWEQTTTTSYKLDAPVVRPVAENTSAIYRHDCLLLHQVNFQAPAGYNSADGYAVNKPKRLQGKNTSYISTGPGPLAHFDGSVAANNNAGVADGNADDRLQSFSFGTYGFKGTRVAFASKANGNLTQTQMEEVAINMYKLVA
nr:hypothetical protein [uncultured Gellertiella sp.]